MITVYLLQSGVTLVADPTERMDRVVNDEATEAITDGDVLLVRNADGEVLAGIPLKNVLYWTTVALDATRVWVQAS